MKLLSCLMLFVSLTANADICNPSSHKFIPLDNLPKIKSTFYNTSNGAIQPTTTLVTSEPKYIRVHPDGNHVIASLEDGTAVILDITDKSNAKIITTPLKNEAAPVEPNWSLISSPYSANGMEYFAFDDLLKDGPNTKAVFSDFRHNQYYQSSSELPGSTPNRTQFRTMLFSTLSVRDYVVEKTKGTHVATLGKVNYLCDNIRESLSQPMLSKDGQHIVALAQLSANPSGSDEASSVTKIYRINPDLSCTEKVDFKFRTGKASFSYSKPGEIEKVAYAVSKTEFRTLRSSSSFVAYVFDQKTGSHTMISLPWVESDAQYPGFTKDGRLMYVTKRNGVSGLVVVDLKNLEVPLEKDMKNKNGPYEHCYTKSAAQPNPPNSTYPQYPTYPATTPEPAPVGR